MKEGNTVVTLKASYLDTLSVGKHELSIVSDMGNADTEFTVKEGATVEDSDESGQTGDDSNMGTFAVLAVLAAAGAAGVGICGR